MATEITKVLDRYHAKLCDAIEPCLRSFTDKLFEKHLIPEEVKDKSTDYNTVIRSFKSNFDFIDDRLKLKTVIYDFFEILDELGGAPRMAVELLKKEIDRALAILCHCQEEAVLKTAKTDKNGNSGKNRYDF